MLGIQNSDSKTTLFPSLVVYAEKLSQNLAADSEMD